MLRIVVYPGVVLAVLSLCPGYFRTFAADEVHLTYISPPAGSCSELELEECISTIGDFSAGIRPAVTLAESQVNQMGTYLHQRRLNIHMMQPESVRKSKKKSTSNSTVAACVVARCITQMCMCI